MKKIIYILGLVVIVSSCKKEELIRPQDLTDPTKAVYKTNTSAAGEEGDPTNIFDDKRKFRIKRIDRVNLGGNNDDDKNGGGTVNVGGNNDDDKNGGGTVNVGGNNDDDRNGSGTSVSGPTAGATGATPNVGDNGDGSGDIGDSGVVPR